MRVGFCRNDGAKKPKAQGVAVLKKLTYQELISVAAAKLKIKKKGRGVQLFVGGCATPSAPPGTLLTHDTPLDTALTNGILIVCVPQGEAYRGPGARAAPAVSSAGAGSHTSRATVPPRWPYPGVPADPEAPTAAAPAEVPVAPPPPAMSARAAGADAALTPKAFAGCFPVLEGNVLGAVRAAAKRFDFIQENTTPLGAVVFDYSGRTAFPPVRTWEDAVARECRGLVVSTSTGRVLARRFHKFFSVGETEETLASTVDWAGATATEKLDGSLCSPVLLDSGDLVWCTRRQRSPEIEAFATAAHTAFARECLEAGRTPLFEWCAQGRASGVVRHPEARLVLLAVRDNTSGLYVEPSPPAGVEAAEHVPMESFEVLQAHVAEATDREGVVVRTRDGQLYKLKTRWWVALSAASLQGKGKGAHNAFLPAVLATYPTLRGVPAGAVWEAVITSSDDINAAVVQALSADDAKAYLAFVHTASAGLDALCEDFVQWGLASFRAAGTKRALYATAGMVGWPPAVVDAALGGRVEVLRPAVAQVLARLVKLGRLDAVGEVLEVAWDPEAGRHVVEDTVLEDLVVFDEAPAPGLADHVVGAYLPRKLANMLGVNLQAVQASTTVHLPASYHPDEGKIRGMFEAWLERGVTDLRIDLQPSRLSGYTAHDGCPTYALLLVQHGGFPGTKGPRGAFAGVLVPTECTVTVGAIQAAMAQSFATRRMIRMRRRPQAAGAASVFVDLDQTLADFEAGVLAATGMPAASQTPSKMWSRILKPGFWTSLGFLPGAKAMWDAIVEAVAPSTPTILTGLPKKHTKMCDKEKRAWVAANLGPGVPVITCPTASKHMYAAPGAILIDDRVETAAKWLTHGGTFIHHVSPERSLFELRKALGTLDLVTMVMPPDEDLLPLPPLPRVVRVDSEWPPALDTVPCVGVDLEWDPADATHPVAVAQVATPDTVFVIDMIAASSRVRDQLCHLLENAAVTKAVFSADAEDVRRLPCTWAGIVDVQDAVRDTVDCAAWRSQLPSLSTVAAVLLRQRLPKSKELQASCWAARPLSDAQVEYAARDAAVTLALLAALPTPVPPRNVFQGAFKAARVQPSSSDLEPNARVTPLYSAVFLSESSKAALASAVPPRHKSLHADHVTLQFAPTEGGLRGLPVGSRVSVTVDGMHTSDTVQAVRAVVPGFDGPHHVTVSTAAGTPPAAAKDVTEWEPLEPALELGGVVGVVVRQTGADPLSTVPERVARRVREFAADALPGQHLKFQASDLSAAERSAVHAFATTTGLDSSSSGRPGARRLTLTKLRGGAPSGPTGDADGRIVAHAGDLDEDSVRSRAKKAVRRQNPVHRVTDMFLFATLRLADASATVEFAAEGRVTPGGVDGVDLGAAIPSDAVVVMRGLPGSGKSTVAAMIAQVLVPVAAPLPPPLSSCVVSADSYFMTPSGYAFDKAQLGEAHDVCLSLATALVEAGCPAVVDNTNSTLREYSRYRKLAAAHGRPLVVVELVCRDRDTAVVFAARNAHGVGTVDVLKMLARWETDDDALLLAPYMAKAGASAPSAGPSFAKWLADNHLVAHGSRGATHLVMGVGTIPTRFLAVPAKRRAAFLKQYVGCEDPKFLVELVQSGRTRVFLDVDFLGDEPMPMALLLDVVHALQRHAPSRVFVTGCVGGAGGGRIKSGFHLRCPDSVVPSGDHARLVRDNTAADLMAIHPDTPWATVLDDAVYGCQTGLRMLGSRKVTRGVDVGRVHRLMLVVDEDGEVVPAGEVGAEDAQLACSIHAV